MPGSPIDTFDASDGELLVHTGVAGRAAKMGHRLTIRMNSWNARVRWEGTEPIEAQLTVEVDSLEVLRGEGGLTPLSGPEKALIRANALKVLDATRFPQIRFDADDIALRGDGYRLRGRLDIHGRSKTRVIDVRVQPHGDSVRLVSEADVRQTEFGIKPYSMFIGAMKVTDDVTVSFHAEPDAPLAARP